MDDRKYSEEAAIKTYRESFAFLIAKFDECQRKFGIHGPGKRDIDWTFHSEPIVTDWDDVPNDERSELYQKRQKAVEALAAGRKGEGVRVLISSHRAGQGIADTATNSIVITTNAALDTLAHEMGHLAYYNTLPELADGFLSHCKDKNNVMSFPPEGDRSKAIIDIYWATGFQKWFAPHRRR